VAPSARWILALVCSAAIAVPAASAAPTATLDPYRGLATWVDIWDTDVWQRPEAAVAAIAARGARTVYLETSNFSQDVAIMRPLRVGRFLEAAHARGLQVVAWYLPGFLKPAQDVERSLAAIRFRSASGHSFDGFALDIESHAVRSVELRTRRLLRVTRDLRNAVGPDYRLGAIIPSPRGLELSPNAWPGFPYAGLAQEFDVFVPMVYFTYRTRTPQRTRAYVKNSIAILRRETADPDVLIHVIGGVGNRARPGQTQAFVDAVCGAGVLGGSLYDFETTSSAKWAQLSRLATCTG
jgi:hypothetical protein